MFLARGYDFTRDLWKQIQKKMGKNPKKVHRAPLTEEDKQNKASLIEFYQSLGLTPKNPKSVLQELCQKQGLEIPIYEKRSQTGPEHDPEFTVKVSGVLFNRPPTWIESAEEKGKSLKLAEMKAAQALCDKFYLPYIAPDE